jgi:hypothetical protein
MSWRIPFASTQIIDKRIDVLVEKRVTLPVEKLIKDLFKGIVIFVTFKPNTKFINSKIVPITKIVDIESPPLIIEKLVSYVFKETQLIILYYYNQNDETMGDGIAILSMLLR